jgi:hypothetical protein
MSRILNLKKEFKILRIFRSVVFFIVLHFNHQALADTLVELGAAYISDKIASPAEGSNASYFYNGGVLFSINKTTWGGWNYSTVSSSENAPSTNTFSSTDTGPYLKWQFGKGEVFNLNFAYNISSKATFTSGSASENWEGTSFWLSWGVTPEVSEGFNVGASINYYSATYSKKVVGGLETIAANSKTWIFPSLLMIKRF